MKMTKTQNSYYWLCDEIHVWQHL